MTLRLERGPVWQVALDRPEKANALSAEMVENLHRVLDEVEGVRPDALILRGNRRHFAAGFDLTGLDAESDGSLGQRLLRIGVLLERFLDLSCLTVAVVEGSAVGAGADLALACDHRVGTPAATFRFPGAAFGVVLGTARLAALTAAHRALAGGDLIDAETAASVGLLTHLTEAPDQVLEGVLTSWALTSPVARPGLLDQSRSLDADGALAALARSVSVPGLRDRIASYAAGPSRQKEHA